MPIADDFSVSASGDIRYTGTTTNYTVLEMHRFLQNLADDANASGDDIIDITTLTPSDRSTDNIITLNTPFNIDDTAAEHLYAGSITQQGGDTIYSGLRVLGAVNNLSTSLAIIQSNSVYQGVNSPFWGDQTTGGYNGDADNNVLMRIMVKSRVSASNIDGQRIRVQARYWGDTFDFFNVTLGQGEAVAAIGTTPDAQNTTLQATVAAYSHITNSLEGFQKIDLNNGNGAQPYYSQWTFTNDATGDGLKAVWEWGKNLTIASSSDTIHGINGELFLGVTHQYNYRFETGSIVTSDLLNWGTGTTAGQGLALAIHSASIGKVWFQLLTGVVPSSGTIVYEVNTAPGLVGQTLETYSGYFQTFQC